jgi:ankyrin repeat protein
MKIWLATLMLIASFGQAAERPTDVDPASVKDQLRTLFLDAAREGRSDELKTFIDAGYDLETRDANGYSAMILAAYHGQGQAVTQLIQAGADPCGQDRRGNTAMMGAIFKGNLAIARQLLEADCSPDQRNNAGQTPAMYAALFQRQEILDALAAKGADLSLKDAAGNDVQHLSRGSFGPR